MAAALRHLKCAHHATFVARLHPTSSHRVQKAQFPVERGATFDRRTRLKCCAHRRPPTRYLHRVGQCAQVEACARNQDWPGLTSSDVYEHIAGRACKVGDREVVARFGEIDAVMRHHGPVDNGRFGRADVHPPIHLHGIDGDDLDVGMDGRIGHCDITLTRGGGTEDDKRPS